MDFGRVDQFRVAGFRFSNPVRDDRDPGILNSPIDKIVNAIRQYPGEVRPVIYRLLLWPVKRHGFCILAGLIKTAISFDTWVAANLMSDSKQRNQSAEDAPIHYRGPQGLSEQAASALGDRFGPNRACESVAEEAFLQHWLTGGGHLFNEEE